MNACRLDLARNLEVFVYFAKISESKLVLFGMVAWLLLDVVVVDELFNSDDKVGGVSGERMTIQDGLIDANVPAYLALQMFLGHVHRVNVSLLLVLLGKTPRAKLADIRSQLFVDGILVP